MTYTVSVQDRKWGHMIQLKRSKCTIAHAANAALEFSKVATLCDAVVTCGSKHIATYRGGILTVWKGKGQKP